MRSSVRRTADFCSRITDRKSTKLQAAVTFAALVRNPGLERAGDIVLELFYDAFLFGDHGFDDIAYCNDPV